MTRRSSSSSIYRAQHRYRHQRLATPCQLGWQRVPTPGVCQAPERPESLQPDARSNEPFVALVVRVNSHAIGPLAAVLCLPLLPSKPTFPVGTAVLKSSYDEDTGDFAGKVVGYDAEEDFYLIEYNDGNPVDISEAE